MMIILPSGHIPGTQIKYPNVTINGKVYQAGRRYMVSPRRCADMQRIIRLYETHCIGLFVPKDHVKDPTDKRHQNGDHPILSAKKMNYRKLRKLEMINRDRVVTFQEAIRILGLAKK